ncbi:MAG: N-acetyl-gamma-glutamyl-phosphate reductase [Termitinemataceae bacterium]|nr:MAG: N-acetyl-gamma-glutamyl-phosphate reductase [Termitinemataceae bacterium]
MVAGIIGAAGYAGSELCRLLASHAEVTELKLSSTSFEGQPLADIYPNLLKCVNAVLVNAEQVVEDSDVVFAALPAGASEAYAKQCHSKNIPFIDISADFRFDDDGETYAAWYGKPYTEPQLHSESVYGLPEMNRQKIKDAACKGGAIIGNPGCYPTSITLGAMPALKLGIAAGDGTIIADSASGITGGGREPNRSYHFPECSDSVSPYKVGCHRHTPEISRNFSIIENRLLKPRHVIFTPHLVPMNRGILSTIYIPLKSDIAHSTPPRPQSSTVQKNLERVHGLYTDFYKNEYFIRVLPLGTYAAASRVRQSNYCDISVHIDQSGSMLIITSAIDNMVKGAAGQAVQNMNIIFGFKENTGLQAIPAAF